MTIWSVFQNPVIYIYCMFKGVHYSQQHKQYKLLIKARIFYRVVVVDVNLNVSSSFVEC